MKLVFAFLVGFLGSAGYLTALYFRFVGGTDENRNIITKPFHSENFLIASLKMVWYCLIGGFIAMIFQIDVPTFVGIQSLILGATWPVIVSQFLSGRMVTPSNEEIESIRKMSEQPISQQFEFDELQQSTKRIAEEVKEKERSKE